MSKERPFIGKWRLYPVGSTTAVEFYWESDRDRTPYTDIALYQVGGNLNGAFDALMAVIRFKLPELGISDWRPYIPLWAFQWDVMGGGPHGSLYIDFPQGPGDPTPPYVFHCKWPTTIAAADNPPPNGDSRQLGVWFLPKELGVPMFGWANEQIGQSLQYDVKIIAPGLFETVLGPLASFGPDNDFSYCDISGEDWSGEQDSNPIEHFDLTGTAFQHVEASGTIFNGDQMAGCTFSGDGWLIKTFFQRVNLTGAVFSVLDASGADFTAANITKGVFKCPIRNAVFRAAVLTGTSFDGVDLTGVDFTEAQLTGTLLTNTDLTHATFSTPPAFSTDNTQLTRLTKSKVPFGILNLNWSYLDLSGATIEGLPKTLDNLQAKFSILTNLTPSMSGYSLKGAVFDNAIMDGIDLSNSDLTNASFILSSLHGATLSNATLEGAKMKGAQLGTLSRFFTLPLTAQTDLDQGPTVDQNLSALFSQQGITLSSSAVLQTVSQKRVWTIVDNNITYTIRLESHAGTDPALEVYKVALAASLSNAYMPNADLSGANLYAAVATNIHFYGSEARIGDSAILELAELNGSNLSNVDFTQAQLLGTNLSDSHLFNAKFNKSNLSPAATGSVAILTSANLQGADFTDAQLYGTNLTNAAVAIKVPTKGNPNQGGVYLFSLPYSGDKTGLQQYEAELNAASTQFTLPLPGDTKSLQTYLTDLEAGKLADFILVFLKQQPPVHLSSSAEIQTITPGSVWQIVDGSQSYNLWTDIKDDGNKGLFVAPSLTNTQAAFQHYDINLRWQASVSVDTAGSQWLIDNDSENPQNTSTGYMSFLLKLDGGVLDVYGTAIRIIRLGDGNQQEYHTETCNVTILGQTNMDAKTICPNGTTLSVNQSDSGETWDEKWLRASASPAPPSCVPTPNSWCPPSATVKKKRDGE